MKSTLEKIRCAPHKGFPATAGVQAGRPLWSLMVKMRHLESVCRFTENDLPIESQAQRPFNPNHARNIWEYLTDEKNRDSYYLPALSATVDEGESAFESLEDPPQVGRLVLSIDARLDIFDGQHRLRAAAMVSDPRLTEESVPIIVRPVGRKESLKLRQALFADVNAHALKVASAIEKVYDHRNPWVALNLCVIRGVPLLDALTNKRKDTLAKSDKELFSIKALYDANVALLAETYNRNDKTFEETVAVGIRFWEAVIQAMPLWQRVFKQELSAGSVRTEDITSFAVTLLGIATVGAKLIRKGGDWPSAVSKLAQVNFERQALHWQQQVIIAGRLIKNKKSVNAIAEQLQLEIGATEDEGPGSSL